MSAVHQLIGEAESSNTVAWVALGVSVLALLWQVVVAIRDRPRLGVVLRRSAFILVNGPTRYEYNLTVMNNGRHGQTVDDVGLVGKDPSYETWLTIMRRDGIEVDGQPLPVTVPPFGFVNWKIPEAVMTGRFPLSEQEFRCYVVRFTTLSRWQWINNKRLALHRRFGRVVGTVYDYQGRYNKMPVRPDQ